VAKVHAAVQHGVVAVAHEGRRAVLLLEVGHHRVVVHGGRPAPLVARSHFVVGRGRDCANQNACESRNVCLPSAARLGIGVSPQGREGRGRGRTGRFIRGDVGKKARRFTAGAGCSLTVRSSPGVCSALCASDGNTERKYDSPDMTTTKESSTLKEDILARPRAEVGLIFDPAAKKRACVRSFAGDGGMD